MAVEHHIRGSAYEAACWLQHLISGSWHDCSAVLLNPPGANYTPLLYTPLLVHYTRGWPCLLNRGVWCRVQKLGGEIALFFSNSEFPRLKSNYDLNRVLVQMPERRSMVETCLKWLQKKKKHRKGVSLCVKYIKNMITQLNPENFWTKLYFNLFLFQLNLKFDSGFIYIYVNRLIDKMINNAHFTNALVTIILHLSPAPSSQAKLA